MILTYEVNDEMQQITSHQAESVTTSINLDLTQQTEKERHISGISCCDTE